MVTLFQISTFSQQARPTMVVTNTRSFTSPLSAVPPSLWAWFYQWAFTCFIIAVETSEKLNSMWTKIDSAISMGKQTGGNSEALHHSAALTSLP